ncbi:MAG TPA: glycogen synthase [Patescibacteria group bacterium]|nr:glycogen synthase [Patescibacteria group bacterium]
MLKVLFAAAEVTPIAKVGGLGDVTGALPKALKDLGVDVRVIIPKYRSIETPRFLPGSKVPIYYVDSPKYFDRELIYGYQDDSVRFSFFCRGILEEAKKNGFEPDLIHLNDYHTSLVPTLLRSIYQKDPFFAQTRTLLTIHNLANQGIADAQDIKEAGISLSGHKINLLLRGILESDYLVAVSPTYAKEIMTKEYGEGLENKLRERSAKLSGILNGIDIVSFDPATDPYLAGNYSRDNISRRQYNKIELARKLGFSKDRPVFGLVTRLVAQKGLDLLVEILPDLAKMPLNLVILGVGEERFEKTLAKASKDYTNIYFWPEFNEGKARLIYGGSDFFLVPSRFEPCGLTQMVAMRYGAVPLVRKTGGLADTVKDGETGLVFDNYRAEELHQTIRRALGIWSKDGAVAKLQQAGMKQDFSWDKSAKEYVKLYQSLLSSRKEFV